MHLLKLCLLFIHSTMGLTVPRVNSINHQLKKMQGLPEKAAVPFFLSGVASSGNSFSRVALSLLEDRKKEEQEALEGRHSGRLWDDAQK